MRNAILTYIKPLGIVGLLYLFLVSIGLMAKSFVLFGGDFAEGLITTTDNPLVGLCIGVLVTSLVQSSSLTTSLVVGMVAGGAMSVTNAVPLIMGANIGTSVTNILVSLGHITRKQEFRRAFAASTVHDFFNVIAVAVLFPLQLATGFLGKAATSLADVFQNSGGLTFTSPVKAV
ncbi:MAG: Na/Pi symporter, partial [Candidatus Latescibacteria bacterium]|nr:Na/Pi symporter [Candidatus Latescibacterota bacterium]